MDGKNKQERELNQKILNRECDNLLNEVKRLQADLNMQKQRLKNVMALVSYITFKSVSNYSYFGYRYTVALISQ